MLQNIYTQLKALTQTHEAFYSATQEIDGYTIENFSYRLVNYQMFSHEFAKEMRGIAFIYGNGITEPELFTLGYHKFFNYGEGETLEEIKGREIESIQDKVDGSLVMFGKLPDGKIIAKSKTSITSFVAEFANSFIAQDAKLYSFVEMILDRGEFPIFEYVGPENRIVVSYEKSELVFLGVRKMNGEYLSSTELGELRKEYIPHIAISQTQKYSNLDELLEKKKIDDGYEGFIVNFTDGYKLKIKLDSYVTKHRAKDDINNMKNLIDICLSEETDDLKSLFVGDEIALKLIADTEEKVFNYYNSVVAGAEKLYEENKSLFEDYRNADSDDEKREARKQIAITNNKSEYFSLLMKMLEGREIDYREFVRSMIEI